MTDKTVTMPWELAAQLTSDDSYLRNAAMYVLRGILAAPVVERQPEPESFMYQHDETGQIGFVDIQQVEWGFENNNPRLKIICQLYRSPLAPVALKDHEFRELVNRLRDIACEYVGSGQLRERISMELRACLDKVKDMNQ